MDMMFVTELLESMKISVELSVMVRVENESAILWQAILLISHI